MEQAFYHREGYYLLPEGFADVDALIAAAQEKELTVTVRRLVENLRIRSNIQKGICIAPYFYSEYEYPVEELTIADHTDLIPVDVTLLTQKEYNQKLRETILAYCPGCLRYKPISNRVQSLNGHFEEIGLNCVCFFRQDSKPSPRVFRNLLNSFGSLSYHFDPAERTEEDFADFVKSMLYMKYARVAKDEAEPVFHVEFKPDFFMTHLTAVLRDYIEKHLYFTQCRIAMPAPDGEISEQVGALLQPENRPAFQKECKKYGVSVAFLRYREETGEKVKRALAELFFDDYARVLYETPGELCLLVLDQCIFLKELHFRAPLLSLCDAGIRVYDQYGEKEYTVSFDMKMKETM